MPGPPKTSTSTLVEDLESSLDVCFTSLVIHYVNDMNQQEIGSGVDQCIQKYLDIVNRIFFSSKKKKDYGYLSRNQSKLSKRMSQN